MQTNNNSRVIKGNSVDKTAAKNQRRLSASQRPRTEMIPKPILRVQRSAKEYMDNLRQRFIVQAKKYIGVPYRQKYLSPEDPLYHSPIFLDCCGLVRRVLWDMADDFGFRLGPWNQSYQFDTLPITVPFEKMKPGDLIFYQAKYYDKSKARKAHDMTHVEIFLGGPTGEQTIGARFSTGTIQIFESYRFESKKWYDAKFHFKSIDTWLRGHCMSFCSQHPWKFKKFRKPQPKPIEGNQVEEQVNQKEDQMEKEDTVDDISTIRNTTQIRLTPVKLPPIKSISTQN